jgi:uncharacterized protein DUF3175
MDLPALTFRAAESNLSGGTGMAAKTSHTGQEAKARGHPKRWSGKVTRTSDALDLEPDVFKGDDPKAIAQSLKRSAEASERRKSEPFRSAMSMLTFYINRAGKNLPKSRVRILEDAKDALRDLYNRPRRGA